MDRKRKVLQLIEAIVVVSFLVLGLFTSVWISVCAIFVWFAFEIYMKWIRPGGSW